MKLYIKQRVFSWGDKFDIYDSSQNVVYYAQGEVFSFFKKLHVYSKTGMQVAYIEQQLTLFLPRFSIYVNGIETAEIVRHVALFGIPIGEAHYTVEGPGWKVHGDIFEHDYEIMAGGRVVASMHKQWLSWGDFYELYIYDDKDTVLALSVALAIDCIMSLYQH